MQQILLMSQSAAMVKTRVYSWNMQVQKIRRNYLDFAETDVRVYPLIISRKELVPGSCHSVVRQPRLNVCAFPPHLQDGIIILFNRQLEY